MLNIISTCGPAYSVHGETLCESDGWSEQLARIVEDIGYDQYSEGYDDGYREGEGSCDECEECEECAE